MVQISPKFIIAIALATILILSGLSLYHTDYRSKPYEKISLPEYFQNEVKMLSFSPDGSMGTPIGNATVNIYGYVTDTGGSPISNLNLSVYIFPWVVHYTTTFNGFYHVVLLKYGTFTAGYKAPGYGTTLRTFTVLSGNSLWENITLKRATFYHISGNTLNNTSAPVGNVKLIFVSFFSYTFGYSSSTSNFNSSLQNGTYAVLTVKKNYKIEPKPLYFNVTGKNLGNLELRMERTNNSSYNIYGYVFNKLGQPVANATVTSYNNAGNSDSPSVKTNSSGYYDISVPYGPNIVKAGGSYFQTNASSLLFVKQNMMYNFSLTAKDPFYASGSGPSGLSFLPSFIERNASRYLKGNLSDLNYNLSTSTNHFSLEAYNTFYNNNKGNMFFKPLRGVVAIDELGTVFYREFNFSQNDGIANVPSFFYGSYRMIIYVNGFNILNESYDFHSSATPIFPVKLVPLPGQVFYISEHITGNNYSFIENGQIVSPLLQYPNLTLYENGIIVNTSYFSSYYSDINGKISLKRTFYYFIDTAQSYEENFTLNTSEVGFMQNNASFTVNSLKAGNMTIYVTLNAVKSISSVLSRDKFSSAPGINSEMLGGSNFNGGILNDSVTSNINNRGYGTYYLHLIYQNSFNRNISEPFVIYAREDGYVYSGIENSTNSVIVIHTNFTGFSGGGLEMYLVSQNYSSQLFNITSSSQIINVNIQERDLKEISITTENSFYRIYDRVAGGNVATFTTPGWFSVFGFTLPLNYSSYKETGFYTEYYYYLPVNQDYEERISPGNPYSGYINNSSTFSTASQAPSNLYLNISSYGTILNISTTINLTVSVHQGTFDLLTSPVRANVVRQYLFDNLNNISLSGNTGYYVITNGTQNIKTSQFVISQSDPLAMEYVNITPEIYQFKMNSSGDTIYNYSALLSAGPSYVENFTFFNYTVVNGVLEEYGPYTVSSGSTLVIGSQSYVFTKSESEISGLDYSYNGAPVSVYLKLNSGTPQPLLVQVGYFVPQNHVYSRSE